jgi:hypothetical protein
MEREGLQKKIPLANMGPRSPEFAFLTVIEREYKFAEYLKTVCHYELQENYIRPILPPLVSRWMGYPA